MKLTFTFAILALSVQVLLVAAADHDIANEQAGSKTLEVDGMMCSDPCHKDATCTAIGDDLYECKCNGELVGDGVTACNRPHGPLDVSNLMEIKRALRRRR